MKKILALILALILTVSLIGCSQQENVTETPAEPATVAPTEPARKTVHILLPEQLESQSAELANLMAVEDTDTNIVNVADADAQIKLLADIASQSKGDGNTAVVTLPLAGDMDAAFAQLLEANVSYALADQIPAGAEAASVANVYYDQYAIGAAVAAWLTEKGLTQNDKVVILQGITEEEAQRTEGFRLYLQGKLEVEGKAIETSWTSLENIVYSDMQGTTRESAKTYFETYLSESDHASTKYIAAWEDHYALGVLDALEGETIDGTNKETFLNGSPVLASCGGNADMQAVLAGTSAFTNTASFGEIRTVRYSNELLKLAVQAMADHLRGAVVEQDQPQPITWVTAE